MEMKHFTLFTFELINNSELLMKIDETQTLCSIPEQSEGVFSLSLSLSRSKPNKNMTTGHLTAIMKWNVSYLHCIHDSDNLYWMEKNVAEHAQEVRFWVNKSIIIVYIARQFTTPANAHQANELHFTFVPFFLLHVSWVPFNSLPSDCNKRNHCPAQQTADVQNA